MSADHNSTTALFKLVNELRASDNREWFLKNRDLYEQPVRDRNAFAMVRDKETSPCFSVLSSSLPSARLEA